MLRFSLRAAVAALAVPVASLAVVGITFAACADATAPGGVPDGDRIVANPADTLFASVTVSNAHSCALTRGGRAFCWGLNTSNQLGTTAVDGRCANTYLQGRCATVPVAVRADVRFAQLVALDLATCGRTPSGRAYCWGSADYVSGGIDPTPVPNAPAFRVLGSNRAGTGQVCGLDRDGAAWCWKAGTTADSDAARPLPRGLRFTSIGDRCGTVANGSVYCWAGTVDTTVFDRESVVLESCVVGASRTQTFYAPCSPDPVRLRGSQPIASVGEGARDCGLDAAGRVFCWGGEVAPFVFGTPDDYRNGYASNRLPTPVSFPVPIARLLKVSSATVCGQDVAGALYCRGASGSGRFGNGLEYDTFAAPVLVAGGMRFTSVDMSSNSACGVTADGAAYCWGYGVNGQLGTGATPPDACLGTTISPPTPLCAFRPRCVASIAGR